MENLPIEILTLILLLATSPGQRRLRRRVSLVCRTWNTIISQNPLFWTEIGLHRSEKEFQQVLKRNPAGPLDVSWTPGSIFKPVGYSTGKLMKLVSAESQRWRSLTLAGPLSEPIQTWFLQVPTSHLTDINICLIQRFPQPEVPKLRLTQDGYPLRNVVLGYVALDWDCSKMTGLRSLRIQGLRGSQPTLSQLHKIISSSPELEVLVLASWDWEAVGSAPTVPNLQPVALNFLKTLILDSIDPCMVEGVILIVTAPNCHNLKIDWIRGNVAQDQSTALQLANLLRGPLKAASALFLTYNQTQGEIMLGMTEEEKKLGEFDIREATSKLAKRRGFYLHMSLGRAAGNNGAARWNYLLRTILRKVLQPLLLGLNIPIQFKLYAPPGHPPPEEGSPNLAYDIFFDLSFAKSLLLLDLPETISIVDYLASPQHAFQENGDSRPLAWPCPRLENVTIMWRGVGRKKLQRALDRLTSNRAGHSIEGQSGGRREEGPLRGSRTARWMKKMKSHLLQALGLSGSRISPPRVDNHDHLRGCDSEDHQCSSIEKIVIKHFYGAKFYIWSKGRWKPSAGQVLQTD
ncbi:hypothetical protein FS837_004498 [Tulasnella sp. UAMH 9824]|nr:hypothetical protein FS837_004498 [Tulasnella sp. UAMH 9824]